MMDILIYLVIGIVLGMIAYSKAVLFHFLIGFNDGDELDDTALLSFVGEWVAKTYNRALAMDTPKQHMLFLITKAIICRLCISGHIGTILGILGMIFLGLPFYTMLIACSVGFTVAYIFS